eukprot:TRINITY_DN5746_c0_g1_i1.p1 TRINITY_DN5746_c0_g1~~TRINITY_DN5746_c0_g1_i1.p1  ORF type:complete len:444 (-),score=93.06 TRINITY_DN5746_c0_g1_i1:381-1712(-)
MIKTNIDTLDAITKLSRFLSKRPRNFGFAGTKDKRGVTCQRVTAFGVTPEEVLGLNYNRGWHQSIVLVDPQLSQRQLRFGDLIGNLFSIVIRFVKPVEEALLQKNCENVAANGILNYYGLQRFGSSTIKTHVVGKLLLQRNWKEAFDSIMRQTTNDPKVNEAKLRFIEDYDWDTALKQIPKKYKLDRMLIEGLKKSGKNSFLGAIHLLPRGNRDLYVHAYQSYLWNRAASLRFKTYGRTVVEGDIVSTKEKPTSMEEEKKTDEKQDIEGNEGNDQNADEDDNEAASVADIIEEESLSFNLVTKDNLAEYGPTDVLVPLLGTNTSLDPKYITSSIYETILKEEGITMEDFKEASKHFFLTGATRRVFVVPGQFEWKSLTFGDLNDELVDPFDEDKAPSTSGKLQALKVRFNLPKSSYATMVLRELMHSSTSFESQMSLLKEGSK